jgi:hypothetical protein
MRQPGDWSVPLALASVACLVAMVGITLTTGASQEWFEIVRDPAAYADGLRQHAGAVRALFGIDSAFVVLYSVFFVVFGQLIARAETRTLLGIALGCLLCTALADMIEDHHILAMLYAAELGHDPGPTELVLQQAVSQVKFNVSAVGLFLYGLAVPRQAVAGKVLALLLTVGTLIQTAWIFAAPVAMLPSGNFGRWAGFVIAFILAIAVLRTLGNRPAGRA